MPRRLIFVACLFFGLTAGDWLACRALMSTMREQFKHWVQSLRNQGFTVTYHDLQGSYAPWSVRLIVPDLSVSGGKAMLPGGLNWHAERLDLSLSLLNPATLTVTPAGEQALKAAGAPGIVFFADRLDAVVPLYTSRPDEIDVAAGDAIQIETPGGGGYGRIT